jgi:membrane-bound serine protease (ClpP class)
MFSWSRDARRLVALGLLVLVAVAADAGAGSSTGPDVGSPRGRSVSAVQPGSHRGITVVQLQGYIDPPVAALARRAITDASRSRSALLFVQVNSRGVLATDVGPLVDAIRRSPVPVVVWVGPSGAHAEGGATLLAEAAPVLFVSPGSNIGAGTPVRLDRPDAASTAATRAELAALAAANGRNPARTSGLATSGLGSAAASQARVTNGVRATIGEVIVTLDGQTVRTSAGPVRLSTAKVIGTGRGRRRQPNQQVVFASLGIGARVQHGLISPRLAYFLLVAGLALIVFEFFAASVGFAAAVGAVAVIAAGYGFSHLPLHWWAAALLAAAIVAFAVDVQAGGVGFWTVLGALVLLIGSFTLYGGSSRLHVPWWEVALVVAATLLFFVTALPAFVRARFSTPTVGREGLIGELGETEVAVDPEGVVIIRGARWRARTNRATPIAAGATARVVAVEGLVLEVEPEAGGARDYRDRARSGGRGGQTGEEPDVPS